MCGSLDVTHGQADAEGQWKSASFGSVQLGRKGAVHCKRHRQSDEVNVIGRVCRYHACPLRATFGSPQTRTLEYCSVHKLDGYIDLVHRKCSFFNCDTVASFGDPGDRMPVACAYHRETGHIYVVSRKCGHLEGCETQAVFGDSNGPAKFCSQHKLPHHIDVVNKKCNIPEGSSNRGFGSSAARMNYKRPRLFAEPLLGAGAPRI
ncbi:hypothetical protein GUITHDRAFT_143914 [Guillardia theta CCMP2712]|uniref:EsV-1-7 n=2 Tax=Guillardia theta TaxID=55529 RepID=L1IS57_GUITC|nr:hypothetical protein GUITHDRAFT_143914 [Guillardia theta CCMP2712]EKX38917.1 hypothetical protein GUITHDRAFT_143914 [Guillardia theta CCMP2712]|eukprot:XP_005825897.1 hypothetical protein GUITHDRAFT_143914 [Guillardia theta CCMP2712]